MKHAWILAVGGLAGCAAGAEPKTGASREATLASDCEVRYLTDRGDDGTTNAVAVAMFDDFGNLTEVERRTGDDGSVSHRETYVYSNPERGELVDRSVDEGADGTIDTRISQLWDNEGRVLQRTEFELNKIVTQRRAEYEGDLLVRVEEDADGDGKYERQQVREYANRRLAHLWDERGDVLFISTLYYGTNGRLRRLVRDRDAGADGIIENRRIRAFRNGRLQSDTRLLVRTEEEQVVAQTTVQFSESQRRTEVDLEGDGVVEQIFVETLGEGGELVSWEADEDADGTADRRESWTYAGERRIATYEVDTDADGHPEQRTTFTYDENRRLTEETRELDIDDSGNAARTVRLTFDRTGLLTSVTETEGDETETTTYTVENECGDIRLRLVPAPIAVPRPGFEAPTVESLAGFRVRPLPAFVPAIDQGD